jgi:alpha-L-arabinofuranosidase
MNRFRFEGEWSSRHAQLYIFALMLSFKTADCSAAADMLEAPVHTAKISVDVGGTSGIGEIPPELFGINANWIQSGFGIIDLGEMISDRSFRNQADPRKRKWIETPNKKISGQLEYFDKGGHDTPWGGKGYPGYFRLTQKAKGYTCLSQLLIGDVVAGERYELHVSAKGIEGQPALIVFFADSTFMPIEELDNISLIKPGTWEDYVFVLEPGKNQSPGLLRVCLVTPGTVDVDEIRLHRIGGQPRLKELARKKLRELGVRSLRWPAGTDADYFDWRESIGPLQGRGENSAEFGILETASFGLHEFLDLCEEEKITPLITVNILQAPEISAELVEYILAPASAPMGALRSKYGRHEPWNVNHFELGNEPSENYRGDSKKEDTVKNYVKLARATSLAMQDKAKSLNRQIELKAILETGFAISDWIQAVPILAVWNGAVLSRDDGLRQYSDQVKGNFYSFFNYRKSERDLFEEVMGGGPTISRTLQDIERKYGKLPPFWLTEYGIMVQKSKPDLILVEKLKDFQSGLSTADILMSAIQSGFRGAYLFNLANGSNWGVMRNDVDFALRPSGLAFSMFSGMSGKRLLPVVIEGGVKVTLKGGDGNNPSKMSYTTLSAVASKEGGELQVLILNKSYDREEQIWVNAKGIVGDNIEVEKLESKNLSDNNDEKPDRVKIVRSSMKKKDGLVVTVLPRSLVKIRYFD